MQRRFLFGLLLVLLVFSTSGVAQAASLAGEWRARINGEDIMLKLHGSGATFSGSYILSITLIIKHKKTTTQSISPVNVVVKVVKNITNVGLILHNKKGVKITVSCVLLKGRLECVAPATQQLLVFTHVKS